jgi:small ligand-binding sensory domain FIST
MRIVQGISRISQRLPQPCLRVGVGIDEFFDCLT